MNIEDIQPVIEVVAQFATCHRLFGDLVGRGQNSHIDLHIALAPEAVKVLAEVTLVLVLFSDASRVGLRDLRGDLGLCLRLLGVGLSLTIGLGTLLALALFGA